MRSTFKFLFSLALATVAFAPVLASAESIDFGHFSQGQLTVSGHGLTGSRPSYQVNFYVNSSFLGNVNTSHGSFSYTTPSGRVHSGDSVSVKVLEFSGQGRHLERSFRVPATVDPRPTYNPDPRPPHGTDPRPTHVPDPRPTYAPDPRPTHRPDPRPTYTSVPDPRPTYRPDPRPTYIPDPRPTNEPISQRALENYANQQARTVANRVAATYGALENWRYNFAEGFWQGYADNSGLSNGAEYRNGYAMGMTQGQGRGFESGRTAAHDRAEAMAPADAQARFVAVVDRQSDPDLQVRVPSMSYEGSAPNLANPSLDDKLRELDGQLQSELRSLAFRSDAYVLTWNALSLNWSLRDVYQYGGRGRYTFVDSWFRGEFAYDEWRANRLGGGYDRAIYNRLDSGQREDFVRYFKRIYNEVIDEKFTRVRNHHDAGAFMRGFWYGQHVGSEMARQTGYNAGYRTSYLESSVQGFRTSFGDEYARAFERKAAFLSTNPVLEVQEMRLKSGNASGVMTAGSHVGIEISHAMNVGRRPLDTVVRIEAGSRSLRVLPTSAAFSLGMSSSLKETAVFMDLGEITADVETDRAHQVAVTVGNVRQTLTFTVGFDTMIRGFASVEFRSPEGQRMARALLTELNQEWKACVNANGNCYAPETAAARNTKLYQVVRFFQQASGAEKGNFLSISGEIRKIADDGAFWHPFVARAFRKMAAEIR